MDIRRRDLESHAVTTLSLSLCSSSSSPSLPSPPPPVAALAHASEASGISITAASPSADTWTTRAYAPPTNTRVSSHRHGTRPNLLDAKGHATIASEAPLTMIEGPIHGYPVDVRALDSAPSSRDPSASPIESRRRSATRCAVRAWGTASRRLSANGSIPILG